MYECMSRDGYKMRSSYPDKNMYRYRMCASCMSRDRYRTCAPNPAKV